MQGLSRMKKQRRAAGRGKRSRDLARDETAFPHAAYYDSTLAAVQQFDGALEGFGHRARQAVSQRAQCFRFDAHHILAGATRDSRLRAGAGFAHCAGALGSSPWEPKTRTCSSFGPPVTGTFLPSNATSTAP